MDKMIYSILSVKKDPEKLDTLLRSLKGIAGADLYAVSSDQISAVVSDINRPDLIANNSNAIDYAGVIETLARKFTLLPMRFGSVMDSIGSINNMLVKNYSEIQNNLQKVENKYEFGLKVFCDPEKLMSELSLESEATNETLQTSYSEMKTSVYREYVNEKLKEHKKEEILLSYVDSVIAELTEFLSQLNTLKKIKKMTSAKNIIDAVFLLKKEDKNELIQAVEDFQSKYPRLNFILTGPWPPYNFVDITIK